MLAAIVLAAATTACNTFPGTAREAPPPVAKPYNAAGTAPPERMEQFYNPRTGSMVYRFCVGDECPLPTPKKPTRKIATVTEIDPGGTTSPVEQDAVFAGGDAGTVPHAAIESHTAVRAALALPKTAANNADAAAIAARLDEQRRALQAAAGVGPSPTRPTTAPKLSVKTLGAAPAAAPLPAPAPTAKPPMRDSLPVLPSTGTSIPSAPSADATDLGGPRLAQAAGAVPSGVAATQPVTEMRDRSAGTA